MIIIPDHSISGSTMIITTSGSTACHLSQGSWGPTAFYITWTGGGGQWGLGACAQNSFMESHLEMLDTCQ